MAVSGIQKNSYNDTGRVSYLASAATGALVGYSLRWAIPITKQEKQDPEYMAKISVLRKAAHDVRVKEIEKIRTEVPQLDGADTFIKLYDENKLTTAEIKKIEGPLSDKLSILLNRVNDAAFKFKLEGRETLAFHTKKIRPGSAFVAIGIGTSVLYAALHNIFREIKKNKYKIQNKEDEYALY